MAERAFLANLLICENQQDSAIEKQKKSCLKYWQIAEGAKIIKIIFILNLKQFNLNTNKKNVLCLF